MLQYEKNQLKNESQNDIDSKSQRRKTIQMRRQATSPGPVQQRSRDPNELSLVEAGEETKEVNLLYPSNDYSFIKPQFLRQ